MRSRFRKGAALLRSGPQAQPNEAPQRGVVQRNGQPAPTRRTWVRLLPPLLGEAMPFLPKSANRPLHIDNKIVRQIGDRSRVHRRGHTDRSRPGDLCWLEERGRNPRGIVPAVVRFDPPGPWAQSTSGSAPRLQRDACRFEPGWVHHAGVAEMEDALGSDPGGLTPLRVRLSPPVPGASRSVGRAMDS